MKNECAKFWSFKRRVENKSAEWEQLPEQKKELLGEVNDTTVTFGVYKKRETEYVIKELLHRCYATRMLEPQAKFVISRMLDDKIDKTWHHRLFESTNTREKELRKNLCYDPGNTYDL